MRTLPFEYAARNLGRSRLRLTACIGGSALVTLLVLAAAAFVSGMTRGLSISGRDDNVILLGAGSEESAERSQIGRHVAELVAAAVPGLRSRLGVPYVSPEIHTTMLLRTHADATEELPAIFRGVTPTAFLVHPQVRIIEGRSPRAGHDEIMVGGLAAARLGLPERDLAVGQTLWFDNRAWTISGRFAAPGTVMDAEIWCPLTELQIATKRDTISCVIVTLDQAEFADLDAFCKQRLDLELVAIRESDYYAALLGYYRPVRLIVLATAGLILVGGLFGGLNLMYAAVSARVRELGTLQVLGFSRRAIVLHLLQESVLVTTAGALLAVAGGLWLLDGLAVRFSMGAFGLVVDSAVVACGLAAGVLLGVVGVLPPAWRCLRRPVYEALRSV